VLSCTSEQRPVNGPDRTARVKQSAREILSQGPDAEGRLFGDTLACGPSLWQEISQDDRIRKAEGTPMVFIVPGPKGLRRADGMFIKDPEVVRLIETRILHEAAACEPFVLRLPTPVELGAYRAMIAWKITQPVLVLETTNHTYLLHFSEDCVFFIEDIGPLGLQDAPGERPARPTAVPACRKAQPGSADGFLWSLRDPDVRVGSTPL
jgi:hypothetical protein